MNPEKKNKICCALLAIHREINKGNHKVSWYRTFKENGFNSPNECKAIKQALLKMEVIKIHKEKGIFWNKEKTAPTPWLVDGIYKTIKDTKNTKETNNKITKSTKSAETKIKLVINDIVIEGDGFTITIIL